MGSMRDEDEEDTGGDCRDEGGSNGHLPSKQREYSLDGRTLCFPASLSVNVATPASYWAANQILHLVGDLPHPAHNRSNFLACQLSCASLPS